MGQVFGLNPFQVVVHHLAPGPEAVSTVAVAFAEACHRALVSMRVNVWNGRDQQLDAVTARIGSICRNAGDIAIGIDIDFNRVSPAIVQQG